MTSKFRDIYWKEIQEIIEDTPVPDNLQFMDDEIYELILHINEAIVEQDSLSKNTSTPPNDATKRFFKSKLVAKLMKYMVNNCPDQLIALLHTKV